VLERQGRSSLPEAGTYRQASLCKLHIAGAFGEADLNK
jgi:hypothetical protein